MLPNPDILNDFAHGKFVLSNLAAKRAKQLREGAPPLVHIQSSHPLTIALAEIAAGKVKVIMSAAVPEILVEPMEASSLLTDDSVPAEFGMLLPALDESEVALVTEVGLIEADTEPDSEGDSDAEDADGLSLSDLAGEEEEEEEFASESGDNVTLSLSDIADEESALEEESGDE